MKDFRAMICVATVLFSLQTLAAALTLSTRKDGIAREVGIRKREESSSSDETIVTMGSFDETIVTMGYIWDHETTVNETVKTFWAPFTHYTSPYFYTTTLDNYYFWVEYSTSDSTFTLSDGSDASVKILATADGLGPGTMWTACNDGTIEGTFSSASSGTFSNFCAYGGYDCFTYIIQSRFGDTTDRLTSLECRTSYSTLSSETIIYREEPAKTGLTSATVSTTSVARASTLPSDSASPGSTPTNIPSPTSSPNTFSSGNPSGSNNAGVIAGSVVGGVAVLAIAGVAILWILKRNKRHSSTPYVVSHTPSNYYAPSSQAEKAPEQGGYDEQRISDVPEYVPPPAQMAYAGSPHAQKTAKSVSQPLSPSSVHVDESQG